MFNIWFSDHAIKNKRDAMTADAQKSVEFSMRLLLEGVYLPHAHPALLSYAHTQKDLDYVLAVIEKALHEMDR